MVLENDVVNDEDMDVREWFNEKKIRKEWFGFLKWFSERWVNGLSQTPLV